VRRRARRLGLIALPCAVAALVLAAGSTVAEFSSEASSAGNVVSAAPDFRAPTVGGSAIAKAAGGTAGFIRQGGSYHVYANASDTGNPASGVADVSADVSAITAGASAVALSAGSFNVDGTSYGYRSAALTADNPLPAGAKGYSVRATDADGNGPATEGFSVTVDNTTPAGADVQAQNGGGTVRRADPGDVVTFTWTEPVDPASVTAGWDGTATPVVVRLVKGAVLAPDTLRVFDPTNSTQLPLGVLTLGTGGYVNGVLGGETATFGLGGTPSTMVRSGSNITITLGSADGASTAAVLLAGTMSWTPSATATDRAGNPSSTAATSEGGAGDVEF
jgi:hypothetical protein